MEPGVHLASSWYGLFVFDACKRYSPLFFISEHLPSLRKSQFPASSKLTVAALSRFVVQIDPTFVRLQCLVLRLRICAQDQSRVFFILLFQFHGLN